MAYILTPADLASVSDLEAAFSTERLLPSWEDIPGEFRRGNLYTELASAIFYGRDLPACEIEMKVSFEPQTLNRAVRAHLKSFGPKHEHEIAGVGYMIAQAAVLHRTEKESK